MMKSTRINIGNGKGSSSKGKEAVESDHELSHIVAERERRKKMTYNYSNLQALLPNIPTKADKSTIINEAVNYIRDLEQTLVQLEKQKKERTQGTPDNKELVDLTSTMLTQQAQGANMDITREAFLAEQGNNWGATGMKSTMFPSNSFHTWTFPNVVLSVSGDVAYINVCAMKKPGQFSNILHVLDKYKLNVLFAQISSDCFKSMFMIHAKVSNFSSLQYPLSEIN